MQFTESEIKPPVCPNQYPVASKAHMRSTVTRIKNIVRRGACSPRDFAIFNDDIFLVSYPKSGNTWTRFLVGNLVSSNDPVSFANIEQYVPDIYAHTDYELRKLPRPRILKSHEYFHPKYKKVIYIVRDPRAVVVSYFFHMQRLGKINSDERLSNFVDHFVTGSIDTYGSWGQHVSSWFWELNHNKDMLRIKYEELLDNPQHELRRMADVIGLNVTPKRIEQAVNASAFDRMRALEKKESDYVRGPKNSTLSFVREGTSKSWEDALDPLDRQKIENTWPDLMKKLGYVG